MCVCVYVCVCVCVCVCAVCVCVYIRKRCKWLNEILIFKFINFISLQLRKKFAEKQKLQKSILTSKDNLEA